VRVREGYTCDCFDGFQLDMTRMACVGECGWAGPGAAGAAAGAGAVWAAWPGVPWQLAFSAAGWDCCRGSPHSPWCSHPTELGGLSWRFSRPLSVGS